MKKPQKFKVPPEPQRHHPAPITPARPQVSPPVTEHKVMEIRHGQNLQKREQMFKDFDMKQKAAPPKPSPFADPEKKKTISALQKLAYEKKK